MRCHVPPRRARLRPPRRSSVRLHPACRSFIVFRSVHAAVGFPAARPFFARIACARVRAFRAGVRIARLIARASRTPDAPLPSVPNTVMHSLRCPESKRRPRKPPLLACSYLTTLFSVSSTRADQGRETATRLLVAPSIRQVVATIYLHPPRQGAHDFECCTVPPAGLDYDTYCRIMAWLWQHMTSS